MLSLIGIILIFSMGAFTVMMGIHIGYNLARPRDRELEESVIDVKIDVEKVIDDIEEEI